MSKSVIIHRFLPPALPLAGSMERFYKFYTFAFLQFFRKVNHPENGKSPRPSAI